LPVNKAYGTKVVFYYILTSKVADIICYKACFLHLILILVIIY